jgi:hypothetical protein
LYYLTSWFRIALRFMDREATTRPETGDWRAALPPSRGGRLVLGVGAGLLLVGVPLLWSWLLYGSGLGSSGVLLGMIGLAAGALAIGAGMMRLLEGRR